jgi:glycosyltransferase involved in cell wall biosynthesis
MRLDIIVPTFNRSTLLPVTIDSLMQAPVPAPHEAYVTVVDNNSTDSTASVIERLRAGYGTRLSYLREREQGLSNARNAGVRHTRGDLIGFIDDDETIVPDWYAVVFRAYENHPDLDFAGGPCLPNWEGSQAPEWLPPGYLSVVGIKYGGGKEALFGKEPGTGMLMGGNAVIHRRCIEKVGHFNPKLGRTSKGLLTAEDEDYYERLIGAGCLGLFLPGMAIKHFIPESRCTKQYHRRWCFWWGVSMGYRSRTQHPAGPLWAGIPRWRYRRALSGTFRAAAGLLGRSSPGEAFAGELAAWCLAGLLYGRHFWN